MISVNVSLMMFCLHTLGSSFSSHLSFYLKTVFIGVASGHQIERVLVGLMRNSMGYFLY